MDLDAILDTIRASSKDAIKEEFKGLIDEARGDRNEFIKYSANQVVTALSYQAQGLIETSDVNTLLKKLKKMAQIEANNSQIRILSRIQKITYRILDIAIDVLVKSIVPVPI